MSGGLFARTPDPTLRCGARASVRTFSPKTHHRTPGLSDDITAARGGTAADRLDGPSAGGVAERPRRPIAWLGSRPASGSPYRRGKGQVGRVRGRRAAGGDP